MHRLPRRFALVSLLFSLAGGCSKESASDQSASALGGSSSANAPAPAPVPPKHLPKPYADVRLGTTLGELSKLFGPVEALQDCKLDFVGGARPSNSNRTPAEGSNWSACANLVDASGMGLSELGGLAQAISDPQSKQGQFELQAAFATLAQVRGSVRAGTLPEAVVHDAGRAVSAEAKNTTMLGAMGLLDGSRTFVRPRQARRPIGAVIDLSCDDFDRERVRSYVLGAYSLGELDGASRNRVANGACRGEYVRNERELQANFVARTGGLAGVGLSRASRADRSILPDDPSSYAIFASRSQLKAPIAKLGAHIAASLERTEDYWKGAISLEAGRDKELWGGAVVWLQDEKVRRVLVNVLDDTDLDSLPALLSKEYGAEPSSKGTTHVWQLPGGARATLDLGAARSLLIEPAGP